MKIKKLLPIASLASVAAIVTPIVTSCTKVIELDYYFPRSETSAGLRNTKPINIKTKKQYEINADLSNIIPPTTNSEPLWTVFVTSDDISKNFTAIKPIDVRVWVDGKELEQTENNGERTDVFSVGEVQENCWVIVGFAAAMDENSKVKLTTAFEEAKNDCFIYFAIAKWSL